MKRGFASSNYPYDRMKEMQRLGGKHSRIHGLGGFSAIGIEERKRIAKMGAKASNAGHTRKKPEDPFDVI